jgi:hypothetical protein
VLERRRRNRRGEDILVDATVADVTDVRLALHTMFGMRKWVVVALALAIIGIVAYLLSQPKEGTVEYHKRKCAEAGVPEWVLKKGVPRTPRRFYERRFTREFDFHTTALINAGYLKESVLVISNSSPMSVWHTAATSDLLGAMPKDVWDCSVIQQTNANTLRVVVPGEWIEKVTEAIHKADVPDAPREWRDSKFRFSKGSENVTP